MTSSSGDTGGERSNYKAPFCHYTLIPSPISLFLSGRSTPRPAANLLGRISPNAMSRRVQCKFFAHGACLKGEHCEFSHDWNAPPNNICTFYQKGKCAYGSRCRYEHAKPSRLHSSVPSTAAELSFSVVQPSGTAGYDAYSSPAVIAEHSDANESFHPPSGPAWGEKLSHQDLPESGQEARSVKSVDPADQSICSFAAAGACPRGNKCPHLHGDPCPTCGKQCLHPYRPHEREEHTKTCEKMQKHVEALRRSQEIECSVCLERVLSKPISAERKFGILSECDHPFCISCIRNWRGSSSASGFDINAALRACPMCRKLSYFVIPSVIWYSSKEEKQEIVNSYKQKLKSIDCKHFDFGNGTCPFGTSCFYKHAYRDGTLEEVVLRHLGDEDGNTVIVKDIRLSDFLSDLHLR